MGIIYIGELCFTKGYLPIGPNLCLYCAVHTYSFQVIAYFTIGEKKYEAVAKNRQRLAEKIAEHYWNGTLHFFEQV